MTLGLVLLLFLLGMANGFYSGLMGTGGNVILIPVLDLVLASFGIEGQELVKYIIAHSLFITVFNGLSVSYKQYRVKNFYPREVLLIGIPAIIAGYGMSEIVKTSLWYDKIYFDILFLIMVFLVAVRFLFYKHPGISPDRHGHRPNSFAFGGLGIFTAITTALSGFGGGIVVIPSLTDIFRIPIKRASSVSIGVVLLIAMGVSISYLNLGSPAVVSEVLSHQYGYISLSLVLPILFGVFVSAPFGVRVAHRTSPPILRYIFGVVMVVLCAKTVMGMV
ncbi:sulfite exporter TauE/SafE family protein [Flavobacteriaceae bacterium 3-367]